MRLAHSFLSNVTTAVTMTNIKIGVMYQEGFEVHLGGHPAIMIFIATFFITMNLSNEQVFLLTTLALTQARPREPDHYLVPWER